MTDVTRLLRAIENGDQTAEHALLPIIYDEMKHLAARHVAGENPGQTLSASDLVHEAYIKLTGTGGQLSFQNRRHLFGAAARAMRHILIDAARRRARAKHGGGFQFVDFLDIVASQPEDQTVALDQALIELATRDPAAAEIVDLHHFAGLPYEKTAELLGLSTYEVRRKWAFARAWLSEQLK